MSERCVECGMPVEGSRGAIHLDVDVCNAALKSEVERLRNDRNNYRESMIGCVKRVKELTKERDEARSESEGWKDACSAKEQDIEALLKRHQELKDNVERLKADNKNLMEQVEREKRLPYRVLATLLVINRDGRKKTPPPPPPPKPTR